MIIIIFIFLLLYYLNYLLKPIESFNNYNQPITLPILIDLVYTWVDGNDINHINKRKQYYKSGSNYNNQYRYDINTLKYSLISVDKYMSWINNIYIVTDNQIPLFNDLPNIYNKIKIIDHTDIINKSYLPTFNSHVIEANLCNIPNLSDIFIYMNDDCFIGNYITYDDIINNNKIIVRLQDKSPPNEYVTNNNFINAWINIDRLLQTTYNNNNKHNYIVHQAQICDKNVMKSNAIKYKKEYDITNNTRFREQNNIAPIGLLLHELLYQNKGIKYDDSNTYYMKMDTYENNIMNLNNIMKMKPKFFCINDNNNFIITQQQLLLFESFFKQYYNL